MSAAIDYRKLIVRRAQEIAARGGVERDYDGFAVTTLDGKPETFRVRRDAEEGHVLCNCADFAARSPQEPGFRCEHILAVKFHLEPPTQAVSAISTDGTGHSHRLGAASREEVDRKEKRMISLAFSDVLKELSQAVSPELVKHRVGWVDGRGREHEVDYVEWHTVADLLDRICPDWSHQVNEVRQIGDFVAVTASITIQGVTRQGVGTGSAYDEKGIKKAEHDALKRAAVKFGVARELYRKEEEMNPSNHNFAPRNDNKSFPSEPVAKTMADLVTPKQLVAIRAIANAQKVNAEEECIKVLGCKPEELSRRAASAFIEHLKSFAVEPPAVRQVV